MADADLHEYMSRQVRALRGSQRFEARQTGCSSASVCHLAGSALAVCPDPHHERAPAVQVPRLPETITPRPRTQKKGTVVQSAGAAPQQPQREHGLAMRTGCRNQSSLDPSSMLPQSPAQCDAGCRNPCRRADQRQPFDIITLQENCAQRGLAHPEAAERKQTQLQHERQVLEATSRGAASGSATSRTMRQQQLAGHNALW